MSMHDDTKNLRIPYQHVYKVEGKAKLRQL